MFAADLGMFPLEAVECFPLRKESGLLNAGSVGCHETRILTHEVQLRGNPLNLLQN